MKYLKLIVLVGVLTMPMFGCAFGTDYVKIFKYSPKGSGSSGSGAEVYVVKAEDNRSQPEYLGQKAGGYVAIEKGLDLSKIMTDSVVSTLESEGYSVKYTDNPGLVVTAGGQKIKYLNTSIDELWTTFVQGFWTVDANARAKVTFELKESGTDRVLWKKVIGKGDTESAMSAPPGLFQDALNAAMTKVMEDFQSNASSGDFKNALMQGSVVEVK